MPIFKYVTETGETKQTEAASPELALKNAPGIASTSGVQLIQPTAPAGGTGTPDTTTGTTKTNTLGDRYKKEKKQIAETYGTIDQPNAEDFIEQYRQRAQAVVNAINAKYASVEAEDAKLVDLMGREQRAGNVLSGLSGSRTGGARTVATAEKGAAIQRKTAEAKASEVAAILADAETRGTEAFRKERDAFVAQQKDKFQAEQDLQNNIRENAFNEIANIATSTSYEDFKRANPALVDQYIDETGMDETALRAAFIRASENAWEKIDSIDAAGQQIYVFRNPDTGEIKTEKIEVPEELGAGFKFYASVGDSGAFVNEKTKQIEFIGGSPSPKGDEFFKPTAEEKSAVLRYAQQLDGFSTEDKEKLKTDSAFFYSILQKAMEDEDFTFERY